MVWEPLALQVFGVITAKTVPAVLDYLGHRLKNALENRKSKGEAESLRKEIEELKKQLEQKNTVGDDDIQTVEAEIEKVRQFQQQNGLEIISDRTHKQWLLEQFEKLTEANQSNTDFRTKIWVQEKLSAIPRDINIMPTPAATDYKVGDKIRICFHSSRDCYLTIFNLGTSGAITVLFPNRLFRDNFIEANRIYTIPDGGYNFDYVLGGPAGTERIRAVVSRRKVNLADINFSNVENVFYTAERSAAAKDILIAEKRMNELPSDNWTVSACEFVVRA